jgi:hypothetical protein
MVVSVLFSVSVVLNDPPSDSIRESSEKRVLEVEPSKGTCLLGFYKVQSIRLSLSMF